jgi:hypothetical protein
MTTSWLLVAVVFLALALFIGVRRYHTKLCNGYELVSMNGSEIVIATPKNDIVTHGTVTMFDVRSPYVTGYTSSEQMDPDTDPVDGYFVLDTENGGIIDGLGERAWRQKLADLGWERPALRKPW